MHWIYSLRSYVWRNQYVQAKLLTPQDWDAVKRQESGFGFKSIIQDEPYGVNLRLTYQVNSKHPHPDYYFETHSFTLFSARLIKLMNDFAVKFEAFPVTMEDKNGHELNHLRYYVFHSLEGYIDAMDEEASEWQGDTKIGIPRLVLDYTKFEHRPLFVCDKIYQPLMRDDLKQEIRRQNITGFDFLAPEKFHSGKHGLVANYDD